TFGVPLYQEQLLSLVEHVGGLDGAGRSRLRRAVSKKDRAEMSAVGSLFIDGASTGSRPAGQVGKLAFDRGTGERLWAEIASAADYTFNAAHSLSCAWLTYCCAFLKANWPGPFAAAALTEGSRDARPGLLLA